MRMASAAEAFGIDTLARYGGRFPTMWELLAENSSLVADVSEKQWGSFGAQKRETRRSQARLGFLGAPAGAGVNRDRGPPRLKMLKGKKQFSLPWPISHVAEDIETEAGTCCTVVYPEVHHFWLIRGSLFRDVHLTVAGRV